MSKFPQVLERIDAEARSYRFRRAALTLVAAILFSVGWLIGIAFRAVWIVLAWAWAAAVVGFRMARDEGPT